MRLITFMLLGMAMTGAAWSQTPPASAGASLSSPTSPTGKTPPGTPSAATPDGRIARDAAGQKVIGHTGTAPGGMPGNTGGVGTGAK